MALVPTFETLEQTHIFDTNFQKQLLSEYKWDYKNKSQEYSKFLANKKALITIIVRQCDETTKTKISLGATYAADRQAGRLIKFLKRLHTVCFGSDDGGLSYTPYKQVVAVKLLNNFSNNKPHDPHGYKEEAKIKYNSVKAIAGKCPNGIATMMALLVAEAVPLDWDEYCALTLNEQLTWEERGDELTKAIPYLMNSKNEHAKKDLCLAYSQGNMTAYPPNIKAMARYLSTQYPNNKPANQRNGKNGDKNKGDYPKSKDKNSNMGDTTGAHVGDTTTIEESTAPSGGACINAHNLETNVQLPRPSRTVEEILGGHPMNDDDFLGSTNPGYMSIDTTNSKEMIAGSHIKVYKLLLFYYQLP